MIKKAWRNERFRYLVIGAYNTVFGYGIFALLWSIWGQLFHYIAILCISHVISVVNAYYGYKTFVFYSRVSGLRAFAKFNTVYLGAFFFNILSLPVLVEGLNFHPLIAQVIIIGLTVMTSYLLHRSYSFSK